MTIEDFAKSKKKSIKIVRNWIKKGYIPGASIEDNYVPKSARTPYTMARAKTASSIYCSIIKAANACLHVFPELYGIEQDEFDGYIRRLEEAGFIEARISDGITYYDATIKAMHISILEEHRNLRKEWSNRREMKTYIRQTFSMFGGEREKVTIRFDNSLLDTVIDKFGVGFGAEYRPEGESNFVVTTDVAVSEQFYAWVCGFGAKAKIVAPEQVVKAFGKHLSDIQKQYK